MKKRSKWRMNGKQDATLYSRVSQRHTLRSSDAETNMFSLVRWNERSSTTPPWATNVRSGVTGVDDSSELVLLGLIHLSNNNKNHKITQQHNKTTTQRHNKTTTQRHNDTTTQHNNTTQQHNNNTITTQQHNNTTIQQHNNTTTTQQHNTNNNTIIQ